VKKDDICYATQNRQDAVKFASPRVDAVIVVGSPNSSTRIGCAKSPRTGARRHGRQRERVAT
jgi:4-hydroxy-3-methylbut-2-enyl diphosphate reductase IspH